LGRTGRPAGRQRRDQARLGPEQARAAPSMGCGRLLAISRLGQALPSVGADVLHGKFGIPFARMQSAYLSACVSAIQSCLVWKRSHTRRVRTRRQRALRGGVWAASRAPKVCCGGNTAVTPHHPAAARRPTSTRAAPPTRVEDCGEAGSGWRAEHADTECPLVGGTAPSPRLPLHASLDSEQQRLGDGRRWCLALT